MINFFFFVIKFICFCVSMCVYVYKHVCAKVCVWRSENNFEELVISSNDVDPRDQTHIIRHGGKHLYPLNHLVG